jgi:hypothetical protein
VLLLGIVEGGESRGSDSGRQEDLLEKVQKPPRGAFRCSRFV